jgi:predicted RecA/RadA family phage recombinase
MKNYIQAGKSLPLTMAADVSSGDPVLIGDLFGIVQADALTGEAVEVLLEGVVSMTRDAADTFAEGALVYFNEGAGEVTTDPAAGANKLIGASVEAAGPSAGSLKVRLNGTTVS